MTAVSSAVESSKHVYRISLPPGEMDEVRRATHGMPAAVADGEIIAAVQGVRKLLMLALKYMSGMSLKTPLARLRDPAPVLARLASPDALSAEATPLIQHAGAVD
jgi:hypothetical protein